MSLNTAKILDNSDITKHKSLMQIPGQEPMTMEQFYIGLVEVRKETES